MNLIEQVKAAGVVGAGGAGFPTHVKINCKADVVIANGAECEPLLEVDQLVMKTYAGEIIKGLRAVMEVTGASEGVICLKKHYHDAVAALQPFLDEGIRLLELDSYYPAGDEQQMVYEVTGRVVPTGGLPLDVGAVVVNVSTLLNIRKATEGIPVMDKYVSVVGEVSQPMTLQVPIGTSFSKLIEAAGGPKDPSGYRLIVGGPCMGRLTEDWEEPVTKTTGGLIVLKADHPLIDRKKDDYNRDVRLAKAVCCQCNLCTQMCPRNMLGLGVEPHKVMRAVAQGKGQLLNELNGIFSCCDCGLCSYYACNFGLNPSKMMTRVKGELARQGVKPIKEIHDEVDPLIDLKRLPVQRLTARLDLTRYDEGTVVVRGLMDVDLVRIPLRMHIGAACTAVVESGSAVSKGDLIASTDKLGANIHASIDGRVRQVTDTYIEIERVL